MSRKNPKEPQHRKESQPHRKEPQIPREAQIPSEPLILAGALSHFSVAQLLRLLQAARATGRLELRRGEEHTDLFVEDGRTLFGRASGATLRVGDVLVRRGEVRPEAIEFVLAFQQDHPGARIGRMLVDSGALTEGQILAAVLAVQRYVVLGILPWREGTFRFWPDEKIANEDIRLDLDVDELLTGVLTDAGIVPEHFGDRKAA